MKDIDYYARVNDEIENENTNNTDTNNNWIFLLIGGILLLLIFFSSDTENINKYKFPLHKINMIMIILNDGLNSNKCFTYFKV